MRNRTRGSLVFEAINCGLMLFVIAVMLYPTAHIIAISLSDPNLVAMGKISLIPRKFTVVAYEVILQDKMIYASYLNTIFYAAGATVTTLLITSMTAYPLAMKEYVFKKPIALLLTITMFFSGGIIPSYLLRQSLHLINTYWVMILPGLSAFNVIMFRAFFQEIPKELRESALLDGCNDASILFKIYLPLSKALLAAFSLFAIVGVWNSWFNALIYLTNEKRYPLQLILRRILFVTTDDIVGASAHMDSIHIKLSVQMAAIVVVMFPILCVYPFIQKYFITGVKVGSLKG